MKQNMFTSKVNKIEQNGLKITFAFVNHFNIQLTIVEYCTSL